MLKSKTMKFVLLSRAVQADDHVQFYEIIQICFD